MQLLQLNNGHLTLNGRTYQECNTLEKEAFNKQLHLQKTPMRYYLLDEDFEPIAERVKITKYLHIDSYDHLHLLPQKDSVSLWVRVSTTGGEILVQDYILTINGRKYTLTQDQIQYLEHRMGIDYGDEFLTEDEQDDDAPFDPYHEYGVKREDFFCI